MGEVLFSHATFHSGLSESDTFSFMTVENGKITGTYAHRPERSFSKVEDLGGRHVYPCLIDAHVHLMLTVAVMAMGFSVCEITVKGVEPGDLAGIEKRVRDYASAQPKGAVVALNNYIVTAIKEHRMPNKQELDEWGGGRPVVIYNIDGHSTALSTKMMELVGIDPESNDGVLSGEENERAQGRIIDAVSSRITPAMLAKGVAAVQNACASYGIGTLAALEGNGDSKGDLTTVLIAFLSRHFAQQVRFYPQYTDLTRADSFRRQMKRPRVGGCGDWEMDGSVGSHSAAFYAPFKDTGETAPCYYSQEQVDDLVRRADAAGCQIASHAIGDAAVDRLVAAYEKLGENGAAEGRGNEEPESAAAQGRVNEELENVRGAAAQGRVNAKSESAANRKVPHRIEHCEFVTDETLKILQKGRYALPMQPGYAWIDKRYLHTYEHYLTEETLQHMRLKSLYDAGVCVCASTDSPVQDLDPYLQMLGMVQFYREEESLSNFEAFTCYTKNGAKALGEEAERGTLEAGKAADFFTAEEDLFSLRPEQLTSFRPASTWYGGKLYRERKGSVGELVRMLFTPAKRI